MYNERVNYQWDFDKAMNQMTETMQQEYDFSGAKRGAVAPTAGKTRITIRVDDDVLAWFRAQVESVGGGNYQTLINQALRAFMTSQYEPLEATLRRAIREEMAEWATENDSTVHLDQPGA